MQFGGIILVEASPSQYSLNDKTSFQKQKSGVYLLRFLIIAN
jgi:hypothetical protein